LKPSPTANKDNSLFEYYSWEYGTKIATNFNDDKIVSKTSSYMYMPTTVS